MPTIKGVPKKEYTIDATGKKLGRVASEAAKFLIGKNLTSFVRNAHPVVTVNITNVSKADISEKKLREKTHARYSLYPGGLVKEPLAKTIEKKGYSEIFRMAIKGMLPKNKLQTPMLKNLNITE
jgi:large subunit ribosomal protein L13